MKDAAERNATELTDVEVRFEWKKLKARGEDSRRKMVTGLSDLEGEDQTTRRHSAGEEAHGL